MKLIRLALAKHVAYLAACLVIGTAWHEVVGHGLTGILCGGKLQYVKVLGFNVWPYIAWTGWEGYGSCDVTGIASKTGENLMALGGSLSTWFVAVVATVLLCVRRWRGGPRTLLAYLGLWWIDLATYLLPVFGLRRSIFWGGRYSEPYEAAVALGISGPLFIALAYASCAVDVACWGAAFRRGSRGVLAPRDGPSAQEDAESRRGPSQRVE